MLCYLNGLSNKKSIPQFIGELLKNIHTVTLGAFISNIIYYNKSVCNKIINKMIFMIQRKLYTLERGKVKFMASWVSRLSIFNTLYKKRMNDSTSLFLIN